MFRDSCLATLSPSRSFDLSTRYVVVLLPYVFPHIAVILLDLLFLHLCFIQFSRYTQIKLASKFNLESLLRKLSFKLFGYCRGASPLEAVWRLSLFSVAGTLFKYLFPQFAIIAAALRRLVGSSGLEPPTLRLSGARSSLLSYEPVCCSRLFPHWWR